MTTRIGNMKLTFGKHKGKTIDYMIKEYRSYLEFLLKHDCDFKYPEIKEYILGCLGLYMDDDPEIPICECGKVAKESICEKKGENHGRRFYTCPDNVYDERTKSSHGGCSNNGYNWFKWGRVGV